MKFFLIFAAFVLAASSHPLEGHDYKFEVEHDHYYHGDSSSLEGDLYKEDDFDHPSYKFEYGVYDPHTHDHKSQWEHRDGDKVTGEYTLDEADGTKRVVSYHADGKTGFHAKVERVGHAVHKY